MKIKAFLILVFFITIKTNGQTRFIKVDSLNLLSNSFLSNQLIFGELHELSGSYEAYSKIIESLDPQKPYKLVLERSYSFSCLMNEYLSGADTLLINRITFHSSSEKDFYKQLYSLNQNTRKNNKLITIGIDLEYQQNFISTLSALNYYLPKTHFKVSNQQIEKINFDAQKTNKEKIEGLFALIDTSKFEQELADQLVKQIALNYTNTLNATSATYLGWGRQREKYLLMNFSKQVNETPYFVFIIGVAHLPTNRFYPAFTKKLSKANSKDFSYFYPIYFNHIEQAYLSKKYFCEHKINPLKHKHELYTYFDKQKGAWLMRAKDTRYLILSN